MKSFFLFSLILFTSISCLKNKISTPLERKIFDNEDDFTTEDEVTSPQTPVEFYKLEVENALSLDDFLKDGNGPGKEYDNELNSVQITKDGHIFIGGYKGLFSSTDQGKTWKTHLQNINVKDIILRKTENAEELYLKTSTDYLFSPDLGLTFYSIKPDSLSAYYGWMVVDDSGYIYIYGKKDGVYGVFFSRDRGKTYNHINDNDSSTDVRCEDLVVDYGYAYFALSELSMGNLGVFKVAVADLFDGKVNFSWPPHSSTQMSFFTKVQSTWYGYGWDQDQDAYVFYLSYDGKNYKKGIHQAFKDFPLNRRPYVDFKQRIFLSLDASKGVAYSTDGGNHFEFLLLNEGFSHQTDGLAKGLMIRDIKIKGDVLYVATKAGLVIAKLKN